jgi:hypothetical protein
MTGRFNATITEVDQLGVAWCRSSRCHPTHDPKCTEVALDGKSVRVRDSKTPHTGELRMNHKSWIGLLRHLGASA